MECFLNGQLICVKVHDKFISLNSHVVKSTYTDPSALTIDKEQSLHFISNACTYLCINVPSQVEHVNVCVDYSVGHKCAMILISHSSAILRTYHIINSNWANCVLNVTCPTQRVNVELLPYFQFSIPQSGTDTDPIKCFLTNGPRVLILYYNRLLIFYEKCDVVNSSEYLLFDDSFYLKNNEKNLNASVLYEMSKENWSVVFLLLSDKISSILTSIAIEKCVENNFKFRKLNVGQFLPPEYATKISCISLEHCSQCIQCQLCVYKNECLVGLKDGYIMKFVDGLIVSCLSLMSINDNCFATSDGCVENLYRFSSDIKIVFTKNRSCFAISLSDCKILQQWDNVSRMFVADFMHRGSKQLLLLFDGGGSGLSLDHFILTDLQGFVIDRQNGCFSTATQPMQSCFSDAKGSVVTALDQQNSMLSKRVSEEEERLITKQRLLEQTLKRLQSVSDDGHHGGNAMSDVPPPVVPLVPLIGRDRSGLCSAVASSTQCCCDPVTVQSPWKRIWDDQLVVGMKVTNVSQRTLSGCVAILEPVLSLSASYDQQAVKTIMLRLFTANTMDNVRGRHQYGNGLSHQCKRMKSSATLHIEQMTIIEPSQCVEVTCSKRLPCLGVLGELKYWVYLQVCADQSSEGIASGDIPGAGIQTNMSCALRKGGRLVVTCGEVIITAADILKRKAFAFDRFSFDIESAEFCDAGEDFERDMLALSCIQQCWTCDVKFVLGSPTTLPRYLCAAGLTFHPTIGQYFLKSSTLQCLDSVRLQLSAYHALPEKKAVIVVFARHCDQFLMFLRHLYQHMPDEVSIRLSDDNRASSQVEELARNLSVELTEKRHLAKRLVERCSYTLSRNKHDHDPPGQLDSKHGVGSTDDKPSVAERTALDREDFERRQQLYRCKGEDKIADDDVARYNATLKPYEANTDAAMNRLRL